MNKYIRIGGDKEIKKRGRVKCGTYSPPRSYESIGYHIHNYHRSLCYIQSCV